MERLAPARVLRTRAHMVAAEVATVGATVVGEWPGPHRGTGGHAPRLVRHGRLLKLVGSSALVERGRATGWGRQRVVWGFDFCASWHE